MDFGDLDEKLFSVPVENCEFAGAQLMPGLGCDQRPDLHIRGQDKVPEIQTHQLQLACQTPELHERALSFDFVLQPTPLQDLTACDNVRWDLFVHYLIG